ncbi:hypothetical protein GDI3889 (plasmid) [Gluconacetobacter diazotrophicus PA1 5]|uniref:Uncharacterized protein n=1 Tax=Gluconacetobacter diazotrophicus (strain ATCC 49037 / DSM 5601 / CCUG 37298 / CIP 103539 / LMG 7603 / PAl5) TaxID=272568 RepID=A9HT24_GLUDA|nr:hypothetical protein GDI3889 [Gluconacetobacter diazotrophicus PA1 5]
MVYRTGLRTAPVFAAASVSDKSDEPYAKQRRVERNKRYQFMPFNSDVACAYFFTRKLCMKIVFIAYIVW